MTKETYDTTEVTLGHSEDAGSNREPWPITARKDSLRGQEWLEFARDVMEHIENYTVPQYGDMPNDQMTSASIDDIKHDMTRYINRMGSNARGATEALRDMLKLAHYACIAHAKLGAQDAQNAS